jgi:hypothetical protein
LDVNLLCVDAQALNGLEECDVIEHLIDFTETVAADPVILEQALVEIPEEVEEEQEKRLQKHRSAREVVKESSKRDIKHPKPSLYVTILTSQLSWQFASSRD